MSIHIYSKEQQAQGGFNNGEIIENKPIGFPQDGGGLKPFSNMFYWAHAYTGDKESLIGLHPHKGFEIMSFILKGEVEHFDTSLQKWIPLKEGDVQIIRSGSGISHAEKLKANTALFQIWVDPNIGKTIYQDASYNDYREGDFPVYEDGGWKRIILAGEGSPMNMDAQQVGIEKWRFEPGEYSISLGNDSYLSLYTISGKLHINGQELNRDSYALIDEATELELRVEEPTEVFMMSNPLQPSHTTYASRFER